MNIKFYIILTLSIFYINNLSANNSEINVFGHKYSIINQDYINTIFQKIYKLNPNENEQSFILAKEALALSTKINWDAGIAESNFLLANVYLDRRDYINQIKCYLIAADRFKKVNSYRGEAESYLGISIAYELNKKFNQSLNYLDKSMEIYKLNKDTFGIKNCYLLYGVNYSLKEDYLTALKCYDSAIAISANNDINADYDSHRSIHSILFNKSIALKNLGKYSEAADNYEILLEKMYSVSKKDYNIGLINQAILLVDAYGNASIEETSKLIKKFGSKSNWLKIANKNLLKVYEFSLLNKDFTMLLDNTKYLSKVYDYTGDYKKALEYSNINASLNDSLNNLERKSTVFTSIADNTIKQISDSLSEDNNKLESGYLSKSFNNKIIFAFIILLILVILNYVIFIIKNRINKVSNAKEIKLRNSIAINLHDDLGSRISGMTMIADYLENTNNIDEQKIKKYLHSIADNGRTAISTMKDIVWTINNNHDDSKSFVNWLKDFGTNFFEPTKINFHFTDRSSKINFNNIIPVQIRQNLNLIYKEALNNAYKHANANNVYVDFNMEKENIILKIKDDGIGIDLERPKMKNNGGNGLVNMKKRIAEYNGKIVIEKLAQGTQLVISISYKKESQYN